MQKGILRKGLVVGIILLFFGTSTIPSLGRDDEKIKDSNLGFAEKGGNILVYVTENSGSIYNRFAFDNDLPSILGNYGYSVTVTDRSITPIITTSLLADYDELWFMSSRYGTPGVLSTAEIDAIFDFRNAGNGILIMGDDYRFLADANQISVPLGATFFGLVYHGTEGSLIQPEFQSHSLFTGVTTIVATDSEGQMNVSGAVTVVATYQGDNLIGVLDDGNGRVVFDVSFTRMMDDGAHGHNWVTQGDTPQYARNIADWLSRVSGQPVADFTWTPTFPNPNEQVSFDASLSYDIDGDIILYEWDWDDDGIFDDNSPTPLIYHTWSVAGSYPVTLRVTDNDNKSDTIVKIVYVSAPFYFIHLTDAHVGTTGGAERFTYVRNMINSLDTQPAFIILSGDLTHWGFMPQKLHHWVTFDNIVSGFNAPVIVCFGNHDYLPFWFDPPLPNQGTTNFVYSNTQFIGMESGGITDYIEGWMWVPWPPFYIPKIDSMPEGNAFSSGQISWLNNSLDLVPGVHKMLFMHHPVFWLGEEGESDGCIFNNRNDFINLARNNLTLVLSGHTHSDNVFVADSNNHHILLLPRPDEHNEYHGTAPWGYWNLQELDASYDLPLYAVTTACSEFLGFREIYIDGDLVRVYSSQQWYEPEGLADYHMDILQILQPWKGNAPNDFNSNITAAARLHVYDSYGNHVGINETGGIDFEIPGAYYEDEPIVNQTTGELINWTWNELINVFCNHTDSYTYVIESLINCTINLTGTFTKKNIGDTNTIYTNISLYKGTKGRLYIENGTPEHLLYLDDDGDGDIDRYIYPNSTFSPPEKPIIQTEAFFGKIAFEYNLLLSTIDPQDEEIFYQMNWGDGNTSDWIGPYTSGETVTVPHAWMEKGKFLVKVRALDSTCRVSEWSEPITVDIVDTSMLKKTLLVGFIINQTQGIDFTWFNAKLVLSIKFNPLNKNWYSADQIILVTNEYLGKIKPKFVIGLFDTLIVSEAVSSKIHPFYERLFGNLNKNQI